MALNPEVIDPSHAAMRAEAFSNASISSESSRANRILEKARLDAKKLIDQAKLVERVYVKGFLPDADEANLMAASIASEDITGIRFDRDSLGRNGDNPEYLRSYFSRFQAVDPKAEYPFPRLSFPTTAVLQYGDREAHVSSMGLLGPLEVYNFSPSFNPNIHLPTLVDPEVRTFAELKRLETLDPGQADQLFEGYRTAAQHLREKGARFKDPKIVRMLAILPTGQDYYTDFVPEVEFPKQKTLKAWNPHLFIEGAVNPSGNYLSNHEPMLTKNRVVYNKDGREASIRVRRPKSEDKAQDTSSSIFKTTPPKLNYLGVMLFPYDVIEKEREAPTPYISHGATMFGAQKGFRDIGGAKVGAGSVGWAGADKRDKSFWGEKFLPERDGQPFIYSVRLLTAQRERLKK